MKRLLVVLCTGIMLTGCVSQKVHNKALEENKYMAERVAHLNNSVKRFKTELSAALGIADNHEETEKILRDWIGQLEGIVNDQDPDIQVIKNPIDNSVVFRVENTLLFSAGSIEISEKGIVSIKKLAKKLKDLPGLIRIDGHTDSQPIKSSTTLAIAEDNMELSVKRALAVRKLVVSSGVSENKIFVSGYGQHQPIAKNGSKGNPKNRRVDIVWMPDSKAVAISNDNDAEIAVGIESETKLENSTSKTEEPKTQEK